jgi:hypothetical protein
MRLGYPSAKGRISIHEPGGDAHQTVGRCQTTHDLRPALNKVTLRRTAGGEDAGWHLKLPDGADRREVTRPLERGKQVLANSRRIVFALSGGIALEPVAQLQTTLVRDLLDENQRSLANVVDDRVSAHACRRPRDR